MAEIVYDFMPCENNFASNPSDVVNLCFPSRTLSQILTIEIARPGIKMLLWVTCLESLSVLVICPRPIDSKSPGPLKPMSIELSSEALNNP